MRVSPELVDVTAGHAPRTKWQQPFDASITDVFQVQADIAGQVASALDVALGASQKETLTEKPTKNLAAYDAFLKGEATQGLILANPPTLRSAITYYEQAVALDSTFAQAWAQLARAHSCYYYNVTPNPTNAEAAKRAADRAIALAPDRPESHLAVGELLRLGSRRQRAGARGIRSRAQGRAGQRRFAHRRRACRAEPGPLGRRCRRISSGPGRSIRVPRPPRGASRRASSDCGDTRKRSPP